MIALELPARADGEAVRRAVARCIGPVRIVRLEQGTRIVVDADDAERLAPLWLRAAMHGGAVWHWDVAEQRASSALLVGGRWWCIGRHDLRSPCSGAILTLVPIPPPAVARAVCRALRSPFRRIRVHAARAAALACARVLGRRDAVAAARAYFVASGPTPSDARAAFSAASRASRPTPRLNGRGAEAAWREVLAPRQGVWRLLGELEAWWS